MGIDGINKTDGRLSWPGIQEGRAASTGETAKPADPGMERNQSGTGEEPAQSLGVWRKNRQPEQEDRLLDAGEAESLLKATAPKIARIPKNRLTGLQDVIDRYWINPEYY